LSICTQKICYITDYINVYIICLTRYTKVTMGDKKAGQENTRKLQRTGEEGASYMVTIPKAIIKRLGWRERQKVTFRQEGEKIIIEDWSEN